MSVIAMTDLDLSNKRVLIREDLNVPVKDGKVASDARLKAAIPSIKAALDAARRLWLCPTWADRPRASTMRSFQCNRL